MLDNIASCFRSTQDHPVTPTVASTRDCLHNRLLLRMAGSVFLGLWFLSIGASNGFAQPAPEDKIILMIANTDGLIEDLGYMVRDLAKKKREWSEIVEPNIELFLDGVDRKLPIRVDVFFDEQQGEFYRPFFPVSNLRLFRNNLDALGITSKKTADKNLYELQDAFIGQMRIRSNHAVFAPEGRAAVVPATLPLVEAELAALLAAKYDAGVIIDNTADGIERRRKSLNKVRSNTLAEIKKKSTESPDEFKLRKLLAENQFTKTTRLYSETDYLEAGWVTDESNQRAVGTLILKPIAGSSLAERVEQIPTLKSRFASLPETKDATATGRLQLPLDSLTQKQLLAVYDAYKPVIDRKIENHETMSAAQKKASQKIVKQLLAILEKGLGSGQFDAMLETRPAGTGDLYVAVGGVAMTDGREVEQVIELLPQISKKIDAKLNVAEENGFHFHQVVVKDGVPPMLKSLFGAPCDISIATSDDVLLVGFGPASLEWVQEIAKQISDRPEPLQYEKFIQFKGKLGPFVKALNAREPNKDRPSLRPMLVEAMSQGDDYIELFDVYSEGRIEGILTAEPGFLRFLGLAVAKFAEENL